MDLFTLIGIVAGIVLLLGAIIMKTSILTFFDVPSLMIVLGGTFASTFISYSGRSIINAMKDMVTVLFKHQIIYSETIDELVKVARVNRKQGKVGLEKLKVESDFMQRGLVMVAAGLKPGAILRQMSIEKQVLSDRARDSHDVIDKMGDMSPAWGMVGTLIGLVIMMLKLDDPSSIGPAMAIALLTTFYGAVLANLIFIPSATKIEHRAQKALKHHDLIIEGILCLAQNESPIMVKDKLTGFLASSENENNNGKSNAPAVKGAKPSGKPGSAPVRKAHRPAQKTAP